MTPGSWLDTLRGRLSELAFLTALVAGGVACAASTPGPVFVAIAFLIVAGVVRFHDAEEAYRQELRQDRAEREKRDQEWEASMAQRLDDGARAQIAQAASDLTKLRSDLDTLGNRLQVIDNRTKKP